MGPAFGVGVFAIEDEADDVMHFPHADDESADEVKSKFAAAALSDGVLEIGVWPETLAIGEKKRWACYD